MKKTSIISSSLLALTALFSASPAGAGINLFQRVQSPTIHSAALSKTWVKNIELAYDTYEECVEYHVKKTCEEQGYSDIEICLLNDQLNVPPKAYNIQYHAEMHCKKLGFTPAEPMPAPTSQEACIESEIQECVQNKFNECLGNGSDIQSCTFKKAFYKIACGPTAQNECQ